MVDKILAKGKKFFKDLSFIVDLEDFTFVWINEKDAKKLGYTSKEMMKFKPQEILDFGGVLNQLRLSKLMHQDEGEIDWKATKKDGSQVTIFTKFHNTRDEEGTHHFIKITKIE